MTDISESRRYILIENCIALSHKIIASYEVAASRGKRFEDFIGIACLHLDSFLKPFFTDQMKQSMETELAERGVSERTYLNDMSSAS